MEYTPIKAILIRNFRNLEEVIINFEDSPIISLVGENEAGKSSVTKAVQTIGANFEPNGQKEYIRTGQKSFLLAIKFADEHETMVLRQKGDGVNAYWVQRGKDIIWQVTKLDDSNVPEEIQKYTGFIIEPETKELLNVRTYADLMLFVYTSTSTNYKIMYNALKVESIANARRIGQSEVNELRRDIKSADDSIETLTEQLRQIRLIDLEPLLSIKTRLQAEQGMMKVIESAALENQKLTKLANEVSVLSDIEQLGEINEVEVYLLNNLYSYKNRLENINSSLVYLDEIENLQEVSVEQCRSLTELLSNKRRLDSLDTTDLNEIEKLQEISIEQCRSLTELLSNKRRLDSLDTTDLNEIDKLEVIDTSWLDSVSLLLQNKKRLQEIDSCIEDVELPSVDSELEYAKQLEQVINLKVKVGSYNNEEKQLESQIEQLEIKLKESGIKTTTCPNCGELVVFGE